MINKNTIFFVTAIWTSAPSFAALNDWAEGTPGHTNGASSDFYNPAASQGWKNYLGDWTDANGIDQGSKAFAVSNIVDDIVKNTALIIGFGIGEADFGDVLDHD
jgi:hypothetical protein